MESPTYPPIAVVQNTDSSQRLLAAQAVLYGDLKRARTIRMAVVLAAAVALAAFTIWANPSAAPVGATGGVVVLLATVFESRRERRFTDVAVSVQEQFDTTVFRLPWNSMAVPHPPTGQEVNTAAARYQGGRTRDWYPDTGGVQRPLDVIICQQSNLGWGAAVHRKWLAAVILATAVLLVVLVAVEVGLRLDWPTALNALVIPFVPVLWEAVNEVMRHLDAAKDKEDTQQRILALWREALARPVCDTRVREVQNCIVEFRRGNAQVPDWFDNAFRARNEQAMRTTAADMAAEAASHGKA